MHDFGIWWKSAEAGIVANQVGVLMYYLAFPILVYGFVVKVKEYHEDFNKLLLLIVTSFVIVASMRYFPDWSWEIDQAFQSYGSEHKKMVDMVIKNCGEKVRLTSELTDAEIDALAGAAKSAEEKSWYEKIKDSLKGAVDATGISTLVSRILDELGRFVKFILVTLGSGVRWVANYFREKFLAILIVLSPLMISFFMVNELRQMAVNYCLVVAGFLLWSIAACFADLVTLEIGNELLVAATALGAGGAGASVTVTTLAVASPPVLVVAIPAMIAFILPFVVCLIVLNIGIPLGVIAILRGGNPASAIMQTAGWGTKSASLAVTAAAAPAFLAKGGSALASGGAGAAKNMMGSMGSKLGSFFGSGSQSGVNMPGPGVASAAAGGSGGGTSGATGGSDGSSGSVGKSTGAGTISKAMAGLADAISQGGKGMGFTSDYNPDVKSGLSTGSQQQGPSSPAGQHVSSSAPSSEPPSTSSNVRSPVQTAAAPSTASGTVSVSGTNTGGQDQFQQTAQQNTPAGSSGFPPTGGTATTAMHSQPDNNPTGDKSGDRMKPAMSSFPSTAQSSSPDTGETSGSGQGQTVASGQGGRKKLRDLSKADQSLVALSSHITGKTISEGPDSSGSSPSDIMSSSDIGGSGDIASGSASAKKSPWQTTASSISPNVTGSTSNAGERSVSAGFETASTSQGNDGTAGSSGQKRNSGRTASKDQATISPNDLSANSSSANSNSNLGAGSAKTASIGGESSTGEHSTPSSGGNMATGANPSLQPTGGGSSLAGISSVSVSSGLSDAFPSDHSIPQSSHSGVVSGSENPTVMKPGTRKSRRDIARSLSDKVNRASGKTNPYSTTRDMLNKVNKEEQS